MDNLVQALYFINCQFTQFSDLYSKPIRPEKWSTQYNKVFYPSLLEMRHHDAWVWLVIIIRFGRRVKVYLKGCCDIAALNLYIRLSHTVNYFLVQVKKSHPCFFSRPHQNVMQHNVGKMRRIYNYI